MGLQPKSALRKESYGVAIVHRLPREGFEKRFPPFVRNIPASRFEEHRAGFRRNGEQYRNLQVQLRQADFPGNRSGMVFHSPRVNRGGRGERATPTRVALFLFPGCPTFDRNPAPVHSHPPVAESGFCGQRGRIAKRVRGVNRPRLNVKGAVASGLVREWQSRRKSVDRESSIRLKGKK